MQSYLSSFYTNTSAPFYVVQLHQSWGESGAPHDDQKWHSWVIFFLHSSGDIFFTQVQFYVVQLHQRCGGSGAPGTSLFLPCWRQQPRLRIGETVDDKTKIKTYKDKDTINAENKAHFTHPLLETPRLRIGQVH